MYCQVCAAANSPDLSFCKRCGASISNGALVVTQPASVTSVTKPALVIASALTVLTLGGFISVITGAVALAKTAGAGSDPVMAIVFLGMLTIMIVDILLARQLSRLITWSMKQTPATLPPRPAQEALPRMATVPVQGIPSVTEHTTRTLPPTFRDTDPKLVSPVNR